MSARNMVRGLRESGALEAPPAAPAWHTTVIFFVSALAFGAVAYLSAIYGVPLLTKAMQKPPPVVSYAKPD
jgi:hypothetical protein